MLRASSVWKRGPETVEFEITTGLTSTTDLRPVLPEPAIQAAVIIVAYNSRDDLAECLAGMDRWADDTVDLHVVLVDCASADGSADFVRDRFPRVKLVESSENLGFAGGNNLGWDHVRQAYPQTRYVALLNPDTVPQPNWLNPLIDRLESNPGTAPGIATCQPLITLHDQPDRINTAGNESHYLGFGFITRCGDPIPDVLTTQQIGYSSGAALMVRADLLARHNLFEPRMFLYCEDTDLGWKLSQLGFRHELVPASRVAHKFKPSASLKHYYHLERNRWWLLLVYYKRPTLVLILPAFLFMELGQVLFAVMRGQLHNKLHAWGYFLNRSNRQRIGDLRRKAQDRRTICDKDFIQNFTGLIDYPTLKGPLVRFIANPILGAYWWLARRLIFW
jgi:GT2 family glycosyltransferase